MSSNSWRALQGEGAASAIQDAIRIPRWAGCYPHIVIQVLRHIAVDDVMVVRSDDDQICVAMPLQPDLADQLTQLARTWRREGETFELWLGSASRAELHEWNDLILAAEHAEVLAERLRRASPVAIRRPARRARAG